MVETISQSHGVRLLRPQNLGASSCFLAKNLQDGGLTYNDAEIMSIVSSTYQTYQSDPNHNSYLAKRVKHGVRWT